VSGALERLATDLAAKVATSLIDRGLAALTDHSAVSEAARETILAHLAASPPDVTIPYHEARRALLGDDEETTG
jgi:hypothetical protein